MAMRILVLLGALAIAHSKIYLKEAFEGSDNVEKLNWVYSTKKGSDAGKFKISAGKFYGDAEKDKGMQTANDAKFYQISKKLDVSFTSGDTLVLQFSVKHEQNIDCGGGYIKLFPADLTQDTMDGDSPYYIMFGPDICGPGTRKVHVIFSYKGKNLLTKKDIRCKDDEMTHLYTLIVKSDNTYEVRIDNEKVESGELEADFDFLAPKQIEDPSAKKPEDWVDNAKMDDPDDKKPEDYDKPELIPDAEAKKPDDWDDEEDGEWEPPMINNPDFKGEWKPKQIDNPAYKGEWVHPMIDNPDYVPDAKLYQFTDIGHAGFEIWQVKSGTIFDNIIVTDTIEEAEAMAKEFESTSKEEKKMKDKLDKEEREKQEAEDAKRKKEDDEKKEDGKEDEEEKEEETEEEPEEKVPEDATESEEPKKDEL